MKKTDWTRRDYARATGLVAAAQEEMWAEELRLGTPFNPDEEPGLLRPDLTRRVQFGERTWYPVATPGYVGWISAPEDGDAYSTFALEESEDDLY